MDMKLYLNVQQCKMNLATAGGDLVGVGSNLSFTTGFEMSFRPKGKMEAANPSRWFLWQLAQRRQR